MKVEPSILAFSALALGCAPKPPALVASPPVSEPPPVASPVMSVAKAAPAPLIALVQPYLVPIAAPAYSTPPTLRGHIYAPMPLSEVPVLPPPATAQPDLPPATTIQPTPSPSPKSASPTPSPIPVGVIRLFEEELSRSVDDARQRLTAANSRATQTASEAKRLWSFVKEGFVAQRQAEAADAAAKDALAQQSESQKALDDAQRRLRDVRRDLETASKRVALRPMGFKVAQTTLPAKTYQAVPNLYRVSLMESSSVNITLQGGTLGRRLDPNVGESAAWLVRTIDPSKLRIGVGERRATILINSLPTAEGRSKA